MIRNEYSHQRMGKASRFQHRSGHTIGRGGLIREQAFSAAEIRQLQYAAEQAEQLAQVLATEGSAYQLDGKRFIDTGHTTIQFEHNAETKEIRVIEPVHELVPAFDRLIDDQRLVEPMQKLVGQTALAL